MELLERKVFLHFVFLRSEQRGRSTCPRAHQLSVLSEGQRGFSLCWPCRGNLQALIDSPVRNSSLSSRKKNLRPVVFFFMELVNIHKLLQVRFVFPAVRCFRVLVHSITNLHSMLILSVCADRISEMNNLIL